jgi:hypothetical protein
MYLQNLCNCLKGDQQLVVKVVLLQFVVIDQIQMSIPEMGNIQLRFHTTNIYIFLSEGDFIIKLIYNSNTK